MVADELDAVSDDEQDYIDEEANYLARCGNDQRPESLKEAERPIPQWSGDSTELKNRSMGSFIGRPVEYHISRLVEMWQVSQPLHLRHLSIIRDSAMTNGIPHYIHYSYENFKRMVEQGKAAWELVMTITKEHVQLKDVAAIEAQPDLDDGGFPKIAVASFQGRHRDASLPDCSRAVDIIEPLLTAGDPRVVHVKGNEWTLKNDIAQSRSQPRRRSTQATTQGHVRSKRPREPNAEPNLVVTYNRGRGRVRKIQAEGFPHGFGQWSVAEKTKFLKSQLAAKLYKMKKFVEEIEKRVKNGADRFEATASVFVLAVKQYRSLGLEPPWDMMDKLKSDTIAPYLLALKGVAQQCSLNKTVKRGRNVSEAVTLWPSSASHSRPLREIEWQNVERLLRSRIQIVQDVPIEQSIPPLRSSIHMDTEQHVAQTNKETSTTPSKAKRDNVLSRAKVKTAQHSKLLKHQSQSSAQIEKAATRYFPSVVAHTRSLLLHELNNVDRQSLKRKQTFDEEALGQKPKRVRTKKLPFDDSPLVASPTKSQNYRLPVQTYEQQIEDLPRPTPGLYVGHEATLYAPGKGGRRRKCLLVVIKSSRIQLLALPPVRNPENFQPLAVQGDPDRNVDSVPLEPPVPRSRNCPTQTYAQQLQSISRPATGFYLGSEAILFQPGKRGRRCKSRLAVFKSPRIRSMTCLSIRDRQIGDQLPVNQSLIHDRQTQSMIRSESISRHTQRRSISRTVSPTPRILAAPEATLGPESSPSVNQAYSTREAEDNEENHLERSIDVDAARVHVLPKPFLATPNQHQEFQDETYDSQGFTNSVIHDDGSPEIDSICGVSSLTHNSILTPMGESSKMQGPSIPRPQTSEIANPAYIQEENPEYRNEILRSSSAAQIIVNPQHSAFALGDQEQSGDISSPSSEHLLQPQKSISHEPRAESEASQAQPIQHATHHDRVSAHLSTEPSATLAGNSSPQNHVGESTKRNFKSGVKKVTLQGGTVAALRRKIIMDIVERCGGIYPGIAELCTPFTDEWQRAGQFGRPEKSTMRTAVKALCDNGKLRQLTFGFKDPRGVVIKKDMLTKFEMSPTDPGVIATQKRIIDMHPCQYIPEETGISKEDRAVHWTPGGRAKMRTIKDLEVDESPVQLETVPKRVEKFEVKYRSRQHRKAEEARRFAELRKLMAAGKLPQKDARIVQRKVDRLESLNQKLVRNPKGQSPRPSTGEQAERDLHPTHMILSRGPAQGKHSQTQLKELLREQTRKRLAELQQEKESTQNQRLTSGRLGRMPKARGGKEFISRPPKETSSHRSRLKDTSRDTNFHVYRNTLMPHEGHSPEARQQMYAIMEPEHIFHPATGTFAVNFSRLRTVNQICHRYHWQISTAKKFGDHVDDLMIYELTANGSQNAEYSNWPFINYTFPHAQTTTCEQEPSTQDLWFSKMGGSRRGYEPIAGERSSTTDPSELQSVQGSGIPAKRKQDTSERPGPFKTRRLTTVAKLSQLMNSGGDASGKIGPIDAFRPKSKKRRDRGLTPAEMRRILIAVIVVRTLTGGVERHIDWVLVTRICDPELDQAYIQKKWPRVLQSYKLLAQQLQANFQDLFLQGYKDGQIPPLDYDNLLAYDWDWLVEWTTKHINTPASGAPDLPSQRDRLERIFELSVGDDTNLHTYYEMDTFASVPRRETDLHKKACVQPLASHRKEESSDLPTKEMEIVKTWIRANVATKARTYNPLLARDKLAQFHTKLIDRALEEMLSDRVLMAHNKGRPMPGRNYDLSEHYLKPLKKKIEAAKFLRAPSIKRRVDKTLAEKGEMIIAEVTDDVEMIVLQNMQAHGRISIVAKNPPMQKFGLTEYGSYKVRLMDKRKLHFQVGVQATESYIEGNPLSPLPDPPLLSPDKENQKTKIPLWYDINGDLIIELWQLALAATMSVLVMRSGITVEMLETSVKPSLALWEVQMILDWMIQAGVAEKKKEDLYSAGEWWWLCLDNEMDVGYEAHEDREGNDLEGGMRERHV
ncbi:MAG: hypothetical protein Q9169_004000 [Polycauliona sp. 2 TL-2023]